jgi:hypothetical protein
MDSENAYRLSENAHRLLEEFREEYFSKHYELLGDKKPRKKPEVTVLWKGMEQVKVRLESLDEDIRVYIADNINEVKFIDLLNKYKEEKGLDDAEIYARANLNRSHFYKLTRDRNILPEKSTIIALGVALKLNIDELNLFLASAGYILSNSSISDLIVKFAIEKKMYNLMDLDAMLYHSNQKTLSRHIK